jgi:class 3 adenylate cyclase/tetratricopeptide (TPR) repeat protein
MLFCDVVGSTAMGERLEAETVRELMLRYFHEMRSAIEGHGGTIEKFVGDAVMAVFGVPEAHEDDPLRACRAAVEMRRRILERNHELERRYGSTLELRIGINTGEVVASDPGLRETFVSGDAVNVAARLEQAASPGEVLLGASTYELVKAAVDAQPAPPIVAKGKAEPLRAFTLISASETPSPRRRLTTPMVGRERELAVLASTYNGVLGGGKPTLALVVGEPGVGKSRLAEEFLQTAAADATVFSGRCLPYGEGITYWPLAEIVRQAAAIHDEHDRPEARRRLLVVAGDEWTADMLAQALGLSDSSATPTEIGRAARRLLERLATARPVVVVLDDVQWAEPALLDLVAGVAARGDGRIMMLCLARPEFAAWPATLRLEPLPTAEATKLARRLGADRLDRVVLAAGGNPLFIEELSAFLAENAGWDGEIPASLEALLTARLDQLPREERMAAERASVEGQVFHRGSVLAMSAPEEQAGAIAAVAALEARGVALPTQADFVDEAAFRFRHLLIRDAAYAGLTKRARSDLHQQLADWLETKTVDRPEYDEIVGHHLEVAYRYRIELAPPDADARILAERAAERLAASGRRASVRWDLRPAINLLERALSLLDREDPRRLPLLSELAHSLIHAQELGRAAAVANEAIRESREAGDAKTGAYALVAWLDAQGRRGVGPENESLDSTLNQAIETFEALNEPRGLGQAWLLKSIAYRSREDWAKRIEALDKALAYAADAGDPEEEAFARIHYGIALLDGPAHFDEVGRGQQANLDWARAKHSLHVEAASLVLGGRIKAYTSDFSQARTLVSDGRALFEELGTKMALVAVSIWSAEVEELTGDLAAAERQYHNALTVADETGDWRRTWLPLDLARLAEAQGRHTEARELALLYEARTEPSDREANPDWLYWRSRAHIEQGQLSQAIELAEHGLSLAAPPENALERGATLVSFAAVMALARQPSRVARLAAEALALFEHKGATAPAAKARNMLTRASTTSS